MPTPFCQPCRRMSWVTVIWSMIAAACLTLALVHGLVWWWRRAARANVVFALTAVATTLLAAGELWMMRAGTPEDFATAVRWTHLPAWLLIVALAGFVRLHLRAGRRWLAWTVCGVRTLSLILNFTTGVNLNYREITALRRLPFLGEPVSVAAGVPNPWMLVGQASLLLFVIFVADAALSVWRRGERRQALVVGGSIVFAALLGTGQASLAFWGILPMPITASLFCMGIVAAMGFELSRELLRAAALSDELRESEQRMSLAVDAANLGIWIRDLKSGGIWATEKWRALFGFTPAEPLTMRHILARLHPEDRQGVERSLAQAQESGGSYEREYRLLLPDGRLRWISSLSRMEFDAQGQPFLIRGASRDFTARKLAEEAAHHLSGRLIHAQEEARKQLARELHDDLGQSLALLSVELEMFGQNPPADPRKITARMGDFSTQVQALSSEVHQLSHELHPAKLEQLGLVAAVRGFCKEFARAHGLAVEFSERDVPGDVPGDAALCLYRIAQEALHNVVKHSGGTAAKVALTRDDGHLRIVVADDGTGFDPQAPRTNGSLGLVSMSERAHFVGGRLTIESRPGAGTRVEVRVPIAAPEDPAPR